MELVPSLETPQVIIVEDNDDLREELFSALAPDFAVRLVSHGEELLTQVAEAKPDVIVVDLTLPGLDGFEICRKLRERLETRFIPILVISGRTDVESRVHAFNLGADDFLQKPFALQEFRARVSSKAKLRNQQPRSLSGSESQLVCGNLTLVPRQMKVQVREGLVSLSALEFRLLEFLVENKETVLSRAVILKEVWDGVVVSGRTIDTHIGTLRKKLDGFDWSFESIYGVGYVLRPMASEKYEVPGAEL